MFARLVRTTDKTWSRLDLIGLKLQGICGQLRGLFRAERGQEIWVRAVHLGHSANHLRGAFRIAGMGWGAGDLSKPGYVRRGMLLGYLAAGVLTLGC